MSAINSYPIKTVIEDGDTFLVYTNASGTTVRIPATAFAAYIGNSFIALPDTPGTYVGKQGQGAIVNATETGLEFLPSTTTPTFITLPDTPGSFSGQYKKYPRVNVTNNGLDFVVPTFLESSDVPTSYTGSETWVVRVNAAGTALEFIDSRYGTAGVVYVTEASQLAGTLSSTVKYFITGQIDMGSQSIEVPAGGLTFGGDSFDISSLNSTAAAYTMFTSPVGGSGNVIGNDCGIAVSGAGSQVFDLVSNTGFDAFEFARINYNNCTSLGTIDNYRQGLETGTGRFGGTPELTLKGAWSGGYFIETSIVRSLTDGAYSLYKAGVGFTMASRFRSNHNVDLPASASFFDFAPANFTNPSTVQMTGALVSRNGVFDATDANLTPNMAASDLEASWSSNIGLPNTFVGGELNVTAEVTSTITVAGTFVDLAGTWTASDSQHFDEPANGQLRHLGKSPVEYTISGQIVLVSTATNVVAVKPVIWRAATSTFVDGKTTTRVINNLQGARDVAYVAVSDHITLNFNDYVKLQVTNITAANNITAELDSFFDVEAR